MSEVFWMGAIDAFGRDKRLASVVCLVDRSCVP